MLFCWPSDSVRVRVLFSVAIVCVAAGTESASFACVITMSYVSASANIYRLLGGWQT